MAVDTDVAPAFDLPALPWTGPLPAADQESEAYWQGLARGEILIRRCPRCRWWVHPPLASCPKCGNPEVMPEAVSGAARLYSFSVVHREFAPGIKPPYVVGLAELSEQRGLRLYANIVNCREDQLLLDMPLQPVFFAITEDVTLLMFEPGSEL